MQNNDLPEKDQNPVTETNGKPKKNLYPFVRHVFLISIVLCVFLLLLFLIYQNGKSIYENGL